MKPSLRWPSKRPPAGADVLRQPVPPILDARAAEFPEPMTVGRYWSHDTEAPDLETSSGRYAARFSGELGHWLLQQQSLALERVLAAATGGRLQVLELGAGHAQITPLLLAQGHSVVAHGSSTACFDQLASLTAESENLQFVASDLRRLPFADQTFDLVVAVRLLGHVRAWRGLVREMTRVSRRYVAIEFARAGGPMLRPLSEAIFWLKRRIEGTTRPFFAYDERTMRQTFEAFGLKPVAGAAQFALPMVVHRVVGRQRWSAGVESGLRKIGFGDRWRSPVIMLGERPLPRSPR